MLTSFELEDVIASDFIDTRSWYFERLQPRYNRLRHDIDALSNAIYDELADNSETFQGAFYRSIIPGIIAVGVGLLLVLMLLFFLESNYSKPIYRMLSSLKNYRNYQRDYLYDFNGEDQLHDLNTEIKELAEENKLLKKRISAMKKSAADK
jgi:predicted PurR-regulated permease PerM